MIPEIREREAVSIRAPARGATSRYAHRRGPRRVSIRAPARGATSDSPNRAIEAVFRSAPPHGGRQRAATAFASARAVSIRAPARGATYYDGPASCSSLFRSAPPHGGRRQHSSLCLPRAAVSIRAPARGATCKRLRVLLIDYVSIRAPARGATVRIGPFGTSAGFRSAPPHGGRRAQRVSGPWCHCFDPRPRTGGDEGRGGRRVAATVSIRAPARGATRMISRSSPRFLFRSAPPHGGATSQCWRFFLLPHGFDPRPRTGGDAGAVSYARAHRGFDPRPRTGGDKSGPPQPPAAAVSIRAPARGATSGVSGEDDGKLFRSAPPHGGRQ